MFADDTSLFPKVKDSNVNPMCSCGSEPETTAHFLLRCQNHVM